MSYLESTITKESNLSKSCCPIYCKLLFFAIDVDERLIIFWSGVQLLLLSRNVPGQGNLHSKKVILESANISTFHVIIRFVAVSLLAKDGSDIESIPC